MRLKKGMTVWYVDNKIGTVTKVTTKEKVKLLSPPYYLTEEGLIVDSSFCFPSEEKANELSMKIKRIHEVFGHYTKK